MKPEEHDAAVDRWLKDEVLPVHDTRKADPSHGRTAEQVGNRLRAHYLMPWQSRP